MADMDKIANMLKSGFESIAEFWPIKLIASCFATCFTWLFGGTEAIFATVLGFVVLDTLTKWACITKKYLMANGAEEDRINVFSLFCGFWLAWKPGYLTSTQLRKCWGDKLLTYLVLILCAGFMGKMPKIALYGLPINSSISGGIYTFIALTEIFSICENFEEMGNKSLESFIKMLTNITNRITGTSFSVGITTGTPLLPGQQTKEPAGDPDERSK